MDISLFYQLWDRLCASAVTGCATLNEDFRLKRAVESFEPLSKANKVFARLYNMCNELFTVENPAPLLADCIALCDALAVTQATFKDNSETHEEEGIADCEVHDLSFSALTNYIIFLLSRYPENLPKDPRILAIIFGENAKQYINNGNIKNYLFSFGKCIVPELKKCLDLSNPDEKGTVVEYVGELAKAEENDWYIELVENENAPKLVREKAVEQLRYDVNNAERLLELYKTEKAAIKNKAANALVEMDVPEAEYILKKITSTTKKLSQNNITLIEKSRNKIAVDFAIEKAREYLANEKDCVYDTGDILKMVSNKPETENFFFDSIHGREYSEAFVNALNGILIQNIALHEDEAFRIMIENLYRKDKQNFALAFMCMLITENRDKSFMDFPEVIDRLRYEIMTILVDTKYNQGKKCYESMIHMSDLRYFVLSLYITKSIENIDRVLEFFADDSYIDLSKKKHSKEKRQMGYRKISESEYICVCINKADYFLHNLYENSAPDDKDKIYNTLMDFTKKTLAKCPCEKSLLTICRNEPQYIIDNPHILEDVIFNTLQNPFMGIITKDTLSEVPRDLIPEVQKILEKLQGKVFNKNKSQIESIKRYLADVTY